MKKIIREADRVIIAGDFWDGWFLTFGEFIESEWSKLFPLLKEKHTIYIYGNHDIESACDERVSLFCDKAEHCYDFELGKNSYHVTHGNRICGDIARRNPLLHLYYRILHDKKHKRLNKGFKLFIHFLERVGYLSMGRNVGLNSINKVSNRNMKEYATNHLKGTYLIAGDSHRPEEDIASHYLNSGFINYGHASYVLVDEAGPHLFEQDY